LLEATGIAERQTELSVEEHNTAAVNLRYPRGWI